MEKKRNQNLRCDRRRVLNIEIERDCWTKDGRSFHRMMERGIKLERVDVFLTKGTGKDSFLKGQPELDEREGKSDVMYKGARCEWSL